MAATDTRQDNMWGEDPSTISKFIGEWAFLSNFHEHPFIWKGEVWKTAEHAFQAAKCVSRIEADAVREAPTPGLAKRLGRRVVLRSDWEESKIKVMRDILAAKFSKEPLRGKLLSTKNADLVEGNSWNDRFWGVCRGQGLNHLGKLLVERRTLIRERDLGLPPSAYRRPDAGHGR